MPENTPTLILPYPVEGDSPDVPRDIKALATALDTSAVGYKKGTHAERPGSGAVNTLYEETDTGHLYKGTGTGWTRLLTGAEAGVNKGHAQQEFNPEIAATGSVLNEFKEPEFPGLGAPGLTVKLTVPENALVEVYFQALWRMLGVGTAKLGLFCTKEGNALEQVKRPGPAPGGQVVETQIENPSELSWVYTNGANLFTEDNTLKSSQYKRPVVIGSPITIQGLSAGIYNIQILYGIISTGKPSIAMQSTSLFASVKLYS